LNEDSVVISDAGRAPIASRLASFITGKPYIQRHADTTPAKARVQQVGGQPRNPIFL
jgi:hypothetical protein